MKKEFFVGLATGLLFLTSNGLAFAVDDATVQKIQDDAATAKSDAAKVFCGAKG